MEWVYFSHVPLSFLFPIRYTRESTWGNLIPQSQQRKPYVLAVDAGDGKQQWQHQIVTGGTTIPYEDNGMVYVAGGSDKSRLYALKSGDSSQVWT